MRAPDLSTSMLIYVLEHSYVTPKKDIFTPVENVFFFVFFFFKQSVDIFKCRAFK